MKCSITGTHLSFLLINLKKKIFTINPSSRDLSEINRGGKPMENFSTLTPKDLAAKKCPSSWTRIRTPKTNIVAQRKVILDLFHLYFLKIIFD